MIEQEEFPRDPEEELLRRGNELRHEMLSMAITPAGFTVPRADELLHGTHWEANIKGGIDEYLQPFALAGATAALYAFEVGASPDLYLDVLGKPVLEDSQRKNPDITDLRDHFDDKLGLVLCDKGATIVLLAQTS